MKTLATWLFAAAVLVLLVIHETGLLEERFGPGAPPGERLLAAEPVAPASLADLRVVDLPRVRWSPGRVTARREVLVHPELGARILELDLELGATVAAGDLVARLDDEAVAQGVTTARQAVAVAASQVAAAEAALGGARAGVDGARVELDHARTEVARQRDLFERQATTDQALQAAEARVRGAEAGLAAARAEVTALEARVEVARAGRSLADEGLVDAERLAAKAEVRAPIDGVVTRRLTEAGALASPAAPLGALRPVDDLWAEAWFQETPVLGDELRVRLEGRLVGSLPVAELTTTADPFTRSRGARVHLAALEDFAAWAPRLAPGSVVELGAVAGSRQVLLVPAAAVRVQGQVQSVRVEREGRVVTRHLRSVPLADVEARAIGLDAAAWRVVRTGLTAGDRVVVEGSSE